MPKETNSNALLTELKKTLKQKKQQAETTQKRVETSVSHPEMASVNQTQLPQSANLSQAEVFSEVPDYVEYLTVVKTDKGKEKRILTPQEFQAIKSNIHQQKLEELNAKLVLNDLVQQQESGSLFYADLLFDPTSETVIGKPTDEPTEYSQIFGQHSEEEIVKSQIAILKDQKKEFLEKLNQAIDENEKKSIDAYRSQLSAIETSMATKINYLEKQKILTLGQEEELYETIAPQDEEVQWATVIVATDGTRSLTYDDQSDQKVGKAVNLEDEQQKLTTKPIQFTKSTIERDALKEQQKKEPSESEQNLEIANPTSTGKGPPVDRSVKPKSAVNRELKPPRLNRVNLFSNPIPGSSLSADQGEREKEKNKKGFACKQ